jgi:N-sulfoglucosamine sulfohydrolase
LTASYYNCLSRLDVGIGAVLQALRSTGKWDDTLVIFLSDHGAQFSRGKGTCFEGGLRVPLLLKPPRNPINRHRVVSTPASVVDLLPTIVDYCGLKAPDLSRGESLRPLVDGAEALSRQHVFAEWTCSSRQQWYPQRCVRDGRYKLIRTLSYTRPNPAAIRYAEAQEWLTGTIPAEISAATSAVQRAYALWRDPPREQLYDLQHDLHEWRNLVDDSAYVTVRDRLRFALAAWRDTTRDWLGDDAATEPPAPLRVRTQ